MFKAGIIISSIQIFSKYSHADPHHLSLDISLFVLVDEVNPLLDIKYYVHLNTAKPLIFDGEKRNTFH